jgi:hypothetical protein
MLDGGNAADDWETLLKAASDDKAEKRLNSAHAFVSKHRD